VAFASELDAAATGTLPHNAAEARASATPTRPLHRHCHHFHCERNDTSRRRLLPSFVSTEREHIANDYSGVGLHRLQSIADALSVQIRETITYSSAA
jgi:hypothetical protein